MTLSRADRSSFATWWWTIDKVALLAMLALIGIGLMLAFAASPAATGGPVTAGDFHYAVKQIAFAVIAAFIMGSTYLLSLRQIQIVAAVAFALAMIGSFLVLFHGQRSAGRQALDRPRLDDVTAVGIPETRLRGFRRCDLLADRAPMRLPKPVITLLLIAPALLFLLLQPDVGQTALLLALWASLLFFTGVSLYWMGALAGAGVLLGGFAYALFPHVRHRNEQFLNPADTG